jgi:hypothetical protein
MDWANPLDPVKPTQSNPKKWVGSGKSVDMDFKNEKPIKKFGLRVKPDSTQITHRPTSVIFFEIFLRKY